MNKPEFTTPSEMKRLIEILEEQQDKERTTPEGYIRLKNGELVML
jgi:predicted lipid-binding transport protein (Tim44 family)